MKLFSKSSDLTTIVTSEGKITLLSLFVPIFFEIFLKNFMNTANVLILSHLSDDAVASVGVATQLLQLVMMLFMVSGIGATVVISQNLGAGNKKRASEMAITAIAIAVIVSVFVGIIGVIFAPQLMKLMQLEYKLITDATSFFRIVVGFSIFSAMITLFSAVARSYGRAKEALYVSFIMNALNAFGSYIVIYRPFETPFYGVTGVAVTRIMSEAITLIVMIILVRRMKLGLDFKCLYPFPIQQIKSILRIAVPTGVESFSYSMSQTVTTAMIAVLGAASVSSKIYVQNIVFYVYLIGLALGQSTSIMIARLIGGGEFERAYRLSFRNLKIVICSNAFFSLIVIIFRYQLIGLFTQNEEIIEMAAKIFIIDFLVEIGRGFNHIEQGSLRAAADVKVPMTVSICSSWCCSILFSYILGVRLGFGLIGCWIAFGMEELVRGALLYRRWKSKKWQRKVTL